jgi:ABC-type lipoprotein release transport system permease subunit
MKLRHLVWRELLHRKLTSAVAILAISTVVAYSASSILGIRCFQQRTQESVAELDDEIRKITKAMGFNINILPAEQNLEHFYAEDFADKTMPYEYVQKLADSKTIITLNHLRPALIRKINWQEHRRQVILFGVSGVIPWTHRKNAEQPLAQPVPPGAMNVGHVLANELGLTAGESVTLNGEPFVVNQIFPARGNKDDITLWIDLPKAQQMLNMPGRINLIQALECNCSAPDRLAEIETEISGVLGNNVRVIELSTTAIARAKARTQVAQQGKTTLNRMRQRSEIELMLLAVAASVIVGVLAWLNVRDRRSEIGILRAIGASTRKILALFLAKALVLGAIGSVLGCILGVVVAWLFESRLSDAVALSSLFVPGLFLVLIFLTPAVTTIASWIPAVLAARQDAAAVLAES